MEQSSRRWLDTSLSVEDRVSALLSAMTIEEKVAQLGGWWAKDLLFRDESLNDRNGFKFDRNRAAASIPHGIGHVSKRSSSTGVVTHEVAKLANEIQQFLKENTRLGIPALFHEESCSGYQCKDATLYPIPLALAATFEPNLVYNMTQQIAPLMRGTGCHQALAPVLDVTRDSRWGRIEETFGEDPYLVARMGSAYIKGLQQGGVVATAKHFVGYGHSEGGKNWAPVQMGVRELQEMFIFPFRVAVQEAGVASVMNAYHEMDGIPCGASKELLTTSLRDDLGFKGVVVSDFYTVNALKGYHRVARTRADAAKMAIQAGLDVELPKLNYFLELKRLIGTDHQLKAELDEAVSRVLKMKFELGLFENPYIEPKLFCYRESEALAAECARKSIVLLKNADNFLPLQFEGRKRRIAVFGRAATDTRLLQGDYHYPAHMEAFTEGELGDAATTEAGNTKPMPVRHETVPMKTPLEALTSALDRSQFEVIHSVGCEYVTTLDVEEDRENRNIEEAVRLANEADMAILFLGCRSGLVHGCSTGESNDSTSITLPGKQRELLIRVASLGIPVVLVIISGRPLGLDVEDKLPNLKSIVQAWVPGQMGGEAIADVLIGKVNPSGKLPVSIPHSVGQIPIFYNRKPSSRSHWKGIYTDLPTCEALYPFGYGLSYTTFELQDFKLIQQAATTVTSTTSPTIMLRVLPTDVLHVGVTVKNTGNRSGEEVVQLYVAVEGASVTRPIKELKGFKRTPVLSCGESLRVTFHLPVALAGYYGRDANRFGLEAGCRLVIMVGSSSDSIAFTQKMLVVGQHHNTPQHNKDMMLEFLPRVFECPADVTEIAEGPKYNAKL